MGMGGDETLEDLVGERRRIVEQVRHRTASLTASSSTAGAPEGAASPRRLSATINTPDSSISPPTTNIGGTYEPLKSFSHPVTYPAAKPAMLPKVLISAMPTAAAAPVRNFAGTVQKLGSAAKIAQAVTVTTATVAAGEPMNSATGTLNPPTTAGPAMCQVRRPRRVASRDQSSSTTAAGRYGIAVMRPFSNTSNLVPNCSWNPLMIVGRKNASAYSP